MGLLTSWMTGGIAVYSWRWCKPILSYGITINGLGYCWVNFNTLRPRINGHHFLDNIFKWMKMYEFGLIFHWSLYLRVQLTIFQHWFRYWAIEDQAENLNSTARPYDQQAFSPDNGLSPGRREAIIWTNAGILLIGPLGTNFSKIFNRNSNITIPEKAFENVVCKRASI